MSNPGAFLASAEVDFSVGRLDGFDQLKNGKAFIDELVKLVPLHPVTLQRAYLVGQIEGQEAAKGNVLPFNDLLIAAAATEQGYAVLTENLGHFDPRYPSPEAIGAPFLPLDFPQRSSPSRVPARQSASCPVVSTS